MKAWVKLAALSSRERRLLLAALCLLPLIRLALAIMGYRHTQSLLGRLFPLRPTAAQVSTNERTLFVAQAGKMVSIAGAHGLLRATCLPQAMLMEGLLRRRGINSQVCFGSRVTQGQLHAHAWLELDGQVVFGGENSPRDFQPLRSGLPQGEKPA